MFRRIRNCIVHSEGRNTDHKPQEIKEYCDRIPTISLNAEARIVLSEDFILLALHIIWQFFIVILESSKKAWKAQHECCDCFNW